MYCDKELTVLLSNKIVKQIKGTIIGMYFQFGGTHEDEIFLCIRENVWCRNKYKKKPKFFLECCWKILNEKSNYSNFVSCGFALGYQTLMNNCDVLYSHIDYYNNKKNYFSDTKVWVNGPINKLKLNYNKNTCHINKKHKYNLD